LFFENKMNIPELEKNNQLANNKLFPFSFPCPHCQKIITSQNFQENNFIIAHLQSFFQPF